MPEITEIEWLGRSRAKVYLDESAAWILTAADIRDLEICEHRVLSDDDCRMIYDRLARQARLKALDLLKMRDYTESELRVRLKNTFYSEQLADDAVAYVKSYHYIDDARYAENYIRLHAENLSRAALISKLRGRGIQPQMIVDALEEADIDESGQIERLIAGKFPDYAQMPADKQKKVYAFLLRRGYTYEEINHVLKK